MKEKSQPIPRVLVALSTVHKACRDKLAGVLRYLYRHGAWDVQILDSHPNIAQLHTFKSWRPDGIIFGGGFVDDTLCAAWRRIPVVQLDEIVSERSPFISHDSRLIGEAAADHLLQLGLAHFAFIGSVPLVANSWVRTRGEAFTARITAANRDCHVYETVHPEDWALEQRNIKAWLMDLPKPCGIMAVHDSHAKQVLDICLVNGIRVPEEVAIVGVDNDLTICESTCPTLSSVAPDFEGGGYLAAEMLDKMITAERNGTSPAVQRDASPPIYYGVKSVVVRQSSQYAGHPSEWLVSEAVEFIRRNACSGIKVPDVARHLNVSRRHVEIRFRAARGRSILDEIQDCRLERVRILLRETHRPIGAIGEICGYESEAHLKKIFKKRFGITMRDYRNGLRP